MKLSNHQQRNLPHGKSIFQLFRYAIVAILIFSFILITSDRSYAEDPSAAIIRPFGNNIVVREGTNTNATPWKRDGNGNLSGELRRFRDTLEIPGDNKSKANLNFISETTVVKEHGGLIISTVPSSDNTEYRFPCGLTRGSVTIGWRKAGANGDRACSEGISVGPGVGKQSYRPNLNYRDGLQASKKILLAQSFSDVIIVPPDSGSKLIPVVANENGTEIITLQGDILVKSGKHLQGRLIPEGNKYSYPQDTITPIDKNSIINSPAVQDFLNPNNWLSPDIPQRVADGIAGQLGELRTALRNGSPAIASNSGNNNNSGQSPLSQLPQRTASQSTQPQQTTSSQQSSDLSGTWTQKTDPFYTADREPGCHPGSIGTPPLPGANEFTIVQSRDGSISIPGNFSGWSSTSGSRGYGSTAGGRVSGNVFTLRAIVGGFTNEYKGTISNDSNTITGRVVCSHSSGSATAEGSFTFTRQGSQASAQTNYCNSRTVTQPTFSSNSHDGTPYRIWMDFSRGQEVSSAVCGRQYWVKEDANHPNYQIRFVYLVDGQGKCVVPYLYKETDGGTLEVVRPAPECSSGS